MRIFALQHVRDAAAEFDYFEPALDVAFRIRDHFAMFGRERVCQFVHVLFDERLEVEHDARATLRIGRGPAGLRLKRGGDGAVEIGLRAERHRRLDLARIGVEHIPRTTAAPALMASDVMVDNTHNFSCERATPGGLACN